MQQPSVGMPSTHTGALLLFFCCVYQDLAPFSPTSFVFDRPFYPISEGEASCAPDSSTRRGRPVSCASIT
jgi:hypothetical protein